MNVSAAPASTSRLVGAAFGLASTLGFSFAAPLGAFLIRLGLDPTTMLVIRMALTTALLALTVQFFSPERFRVDSRGFRAAMTAGLATGVSNILFFWSLTRLEASIAAMLFAIFPIVVLALLALRGERFTYRNLVRTGLGVTGVYLLIGPGGEVDPLGVLMVLASVLLSSIQMVLIQWSLQGYDGRTVTLYMVAGMTAAVWLWWLIQQPEWSIPGWQGWLGIGLMAIVSTYLARLGMFAAVRRLGSGEVALLVPLETLLTVVWSLVFLGERLSFFQQVGGGLIVASTLLAVQRMSRVRRWRPRWRVWNRI